MRSALRRLNGFVAIRYPSVAATRAHLVLPAALVVAIAAYVVGYATPVNPRDILDTDEAWGIALVVGFLVAGLWIVLRCVDHRETAHGRGVRHLGVLWLHLVCVVAILAPAWTLAFGLEAGIRNAFDHSEVAADARVLLDEKSRESSRASRTEREERQEQLERKYANESRNRHWAARYNLERICSAFGMSQGKRRNDNHRSDESLICLLAALSAGVVAHGFSVVGLSGLIGGALVTGAVGLLAALGEVIDVDELGAYVATVAYLIILSWTLLILVGKRCSAPRRMALGAVLLVGPFAAGFVEVVLDDLFGLDVDYPEVFLIGGILMLLATPLFQLILNRYRALPE